MAFFNVRYLLLVVFKSRNGHMHQSDDTRDIRTVCSLLLSTVFFFPFSEKERGLLLLLSMARDLEIGLEREMFATTTDGVCLSLLSCLFGSVHPAPTTGEPGKK
jgi:hypothetical protein